MRKRPYPRDSDIASAITKALSRYPLIKPDEFVEAVLHALEDEGFYTRLVTAKRVWRVYEKLVRSGRLYDYLMVVKRSRGRGEDA